MIDGMLPHEATQQLHDFCVPDDIIEEMVRRHEASTARIATLEEPLGLGRENALHWYAGPRADDKNWPAYEKHLLRTLDSAEVKKIDEASDRVVAMMDHPATPAFRSRGLVLGHVQSGKTSNFNAVVCKAADRGYRMFIVLSGITNSLRRQTQTRLIRDLVDLNPPLWHQITKPEHDFVPPPNAQSFLASKDQRLLLVVKKNGPVLRKLRDWLEEAREQLVNCPTLIIDDEADQATVATRRINPLIRDVIGRLTKVCYAGYTATPFANLLIDPANQEDFYPRDFILSLPRSEAYQGPEALFGRNPLDGEDPAEVPGGRDMIRTVAPAELNYLRPANRAAISGFTPGITPSLRRAVLWFWLATAARHCRGQIDQHSSMLIHAHSDTRVHDSYGPLLEALRTEVVQGLSEGSEILHEMRRLWEEEAVRVDPNEWGNSVLAYEAVLDRLPGVVATTRVIMDHYRSTHRLDYDSGPVNVIAVGGNTLSRGLTLEGLVVSYFVRSSNVYDSLLQMGRWFGYRPGYEDLPRIFMPDETRRWFTHLATVEAEMRLDIDRYLTEHQSPLDMAVRIQCHPKMRVTAPSKSRDAVRAAASYGGQLMETRYFPCRETEHDQQWHADNATSVQELLRASQRDGRVDSQVSPGRALWREVPMDPVLDFLGSYRFHRNTVEADRDLVREYIKRRNKSGALLTWNVGVVGNKPATGHAPVLLPNGLVVGRVIRTRLGSNAGDPVADIKTLTGSRDEALDLEIPKDEGKVNRSLLQRLRVKQQADRGLILLYPIDAESPVPTRKRNGVEEAVPGRAPLNAPGDVVWGVAVVFPQPTGTDATIEYDYLQADLSKVFPSSAEDDMDDDASVLDLDLDTCPEHSA
ncbi:Z1 domain-containing protein [Streptomyces sp. NPDC001135]